MKNRDGRLIRKEAKRDEKKKATQGQIDQDVQPFLLPSERVLCAGAPGAYSPWLVFAVPNQVVRRFLAIPLLPARFVAQGEGLAARFVVTDARIIVLKRFRHRWITSVPTREISWVAVERGEKGLWNGTNVQYSEVVQVSLNWRQEQGFRIWFKEPWLAEGDAIANAIRERVAAAGN